MDIKKLILERIKDKGWVKSAEIIKKTGFSREYVGRFLRQLQEEGIIVMVGKANQARYVAANSRAVNKAKQLILSKRLTLQNKNLKEDLVLEQLKRETGIWLGLPGNTSAILDYGFTEMLNNAIEHSQSKKITVQISHGPGQIVFEVVDQGIGIYKNIMRRHKLDNQEQAIEELMKGKQTTMPRAHSGEGIFFCSKVADILLIQGRDKSLEFNNIIGDIFVKTRHSRTPGTRVVFRLSPKTKKSLDSVFRKYSDGAFTFSKTQVKVKMFSGKSDYLSRSQARRLVSGLDKFKTIILDFSQVPAIGQAFADEVFRVFQKRNPEIAIQPINMNEAARFMVNRARTVR